MNQLPPPKPLSGVRRKCCREIQQFRLYLNATGYDKKPAQVQCSTLQLLTVAGEEALEIFNTFGLSEEGKVKIDVVIKKFEECCNLRAACVQGTRSDRRNRCLRHGIAQAYKKL